MNDIYLKKCEEFIDIFEFIQDTLNDLLYITNEDQLDLFVNCEFFITKVHNVIKLNDSFIDLIGEDPTEKCDEIIGRLKVMRGYLRGDLKDDELYCADYDFILNYIISEFSRCEPYIGL